MAYVRLLLGRWKLVAGTVGVCVTLAVLNYVMSPKLYRASTTLQIEQRTLATVSSSRNPWLDQWASMKYLPTQYRLLKSRGLAELVVRRLHLDDDPAFTGRSQQAPRSGDDAVTAADDDRYLAGLAGRLIGGLDVDPIEGTELVEIAWTGTDPELTARVADGFAQTFIEWGAANRATSVDEASRYLEQQIADLKVQIQQKEEQLQQYGRQTDIVAADPGTNVALQRLNRLNEQYAAAQSDALAKEQRYRELQSTAASTLAGESTGVSNLEEQTRQLEADYESKLQTYKPEWPEMVELKGQIDDARRRLQQAVDRAANEVRQGAYAEWQAALGTVRRIEQQQDQAKSETLDANLDLVEYYNLESEISARRQMLNDLMTRLSEAGVSANLGQSGPNNVRVVDAALVPSAPFRPSLKRNLGLGLAVGLVLGIGLVFAFYFLDRTVKSPDELQSLLGLPVLAVIPEVSGSPTESYGTYGASPGKSRGERKKNREVGVEIELLPEHHPRWAVAEAYRSFRTALMLSTADRLQVVTVTSAEAGEGKTTTALNLAVVMAQLGRKVLLVDADLRKPRIHRVFKVSNRCGLVSCLTGSAEPETAIRSTDVAGLKVCTSGPTPPNPSELLASERMARFLEAARQTFDFVVVDTPPVLAVSDAILPGSRSDGVVLCFRANTVHREAVTECRDRLRFADVKILGAVFNRQRPVGGKYYKSSYHYYQSYAEPSEADSAA
ncbi:MAG: polysaccharide biosynthesis tyrosine autokinase [Thermoanaerobaculia bacterium]